MTGYVPVGCLCEGQRRAHLCSGVLGLGGSRQPLLTIVIVVCASPLFGRVGVLSIWIGTTDRLMPVRTGQTIQLTCAPGA